MAPKTDIIIISYNTRELTRRCVDSILNTADPETTGIIVVDNNSADGTAEMVSGEYPGIKLIKNNANVGYAAAVNRGVLHSEAEVIIISNSDIEFTKDAIEKLSKYTLKNVEVGCVGPQQVFPDGSWQRSYGDFPGIRLALKEFFFAEMLRNGIRKLFWKRLPIDRLPKEADYIDGACIAIRRELFENAGGFDEDYFFYTEEADFCYRLKKNGYVSIFNPKAKIMHYRGAATGEPGTNIKALRMLVESKILFCKKHYIRRNMLNYIILEKLNCAEKAAFWRIISMASGKNKNHALAKIDYYRKMKKIWAENLELIKRNRV